MKLLSKQYKLVSREYKKNDTIIEIKGLKIGQDKTVIAGPCAIESYKQLDEIARFLITMGVKILRGGAFKPRTSPYAFQGLKQEGLMYMEEIAKKYGMVTITEAVSIETLTEVSKHCDIIQIGARNMTNYELLKQLGNYKNPILLKRGMASTIEEFLTAAEYIMTNGNNQVILCERGIRTFETYTRNTLDLSAVAAIKELSHLPIFVDPSHGTGKKSLVIPMSKASFACGADGIMVEVHHDPNIALSDGEQSLDFISFEKLIREI